MSLIEETVKKEKRRIEYMLNEYNQRLALLPKGSVVEVKKNSSVYCYLKFRKGKQVISKYIQKEDIEIIKKQIQERKHIEKMIIELKEELKTAKKALGEK